MDKKKKHKALHPMLLLLIVVVLCALATYVIPAGSYARVSDKATGYELADPESFSFIERTPAGVGDLLMSFTLGMQEAADIIFYLLIIGGMFGIVGGTGALNVSIANLMKLLKGREFLLIPVLMLIFGSGSAFCGNFEEYLVFVPLVLACCITAGYDSLTAVGVIFLAAAAGYAGSITNAFTTGTAQQIAGLPLFSGMKLRVILFIVLELVSIAYVLWYARMIKKNPKLSGAYEYDQENNQDKLLDLERIPRLKKRQIAVLILFFASLVLAVLGVIFKGFYVDELSAVFLLAGIACGIAGGLKPGNICKYFVDGAKDMLLPGMLIGLANAAVLLLRDANVLDTIIHSLSELLEPLSANLMACGMFIFHELLNVVVPSGSAQARYAMPLMVSIADAGGVSRQVAVLAYQLGDAFTNVLAPTGGEILAALAICKVPFGKWLRFLLPLFVMWVVIAMVFLVTAVQIAYV